MQRRLAVWTISLCAALAAPTPLLPAIQPLRINVAKSTSRTVKTIATRPWSRTKQRVQTVTYKIELTNISSRPLTDLKVKWTVLIKSGSRSWGRWATASYRPSRVVEGERMVSLGLGQRLLIETGPIELTVIQLDTTYGYRERSGEEIHGYCIQVFAGDKLVAQEIVPPDTKQKIEALQRQRKPALGAPQGCGDRCRPMR